MSVSSVSSSSILSSLAAATAQTSTSSSSSSSSSSSTSSASGLGENDFLKLLVTQLSNQDPLNPMDDQSFVAQLAQFSSLEQLTNINSGISKLNTTTAQQQMFNASSLIGKEVIAAGNSVVKSGTSVGTAYYTLPSAASDVTLTITNSSGSTVRTVDLGAQSTGQSKYQWDGTDGNGTTEADGTYTFSVSATGTNGSSLSVTTASTGIVSGVNSSSGTNTITTTDGRTVNFTDVQGVVSAPTSS